LTKALYSLLTSANDNMAAPQMPKTPARPAEPLLASQVISDQELYHLLEAACNGDGAKKRNQGELLSVGIKSLDDALGGGIVGGRVVGMSDEAGAGGSAVSSTRTRRMGWIAAKSKGYHADMHSSVDCCSRDLY
jgi:hypothetical protein